MDVIDPAIDIQKTPDLQQVVSGDTVTFDILVTNTGDVDLANVTVTDALAPNCDRDIGDLAAGASVSYQCTLADVTADFTNVAAVTGDPPVGPPVTDEDPADVEVLAGGGQGCTPGYWKQPHHFDSWVAYTPDQLFGSVFEDAFPGKTLLQVLRQGGGGLKALGRHTVAALLNASNAGVSYDLSAAGVIGAFNEVYPGSKRQYNAVKDGFEDFNEQGCPLN